MFQYEYNNETLSEDELRRRFYYVTFPQVIKPDELPDGVTQVAVDEPVPVVTLEESRANKTNQIIAESNARRNVIQLGYSQGEVDTFAQQYLGALFILGEGGNAEDSLFVSGLLSVRLGKIPTTTELKTFAQKIKTNHDLARDAIVQVLGTQQNLEEQIRNAQSVEEVEAIEWK